MNNYGGVRCPDSIHVYKGSVENLLVLVSNVPYPASDSVCVLS